MKAKLTGDQKRRIADLKYQIIKERKYIPQGQGDGINQYLKIKQLNYQIEDIKNEAVNIYS